MWWTESWPMHWMFVGPVLFFLLCALVMFLMMRGGMACHRTGVRALDVLRERFAKGEINKAEFEERRRLLQD